MSGVVSFVEALEVVRSHAGRLQFPPTEQVNLLQCAGRVLAEDVRADRDEPPFDRSTRDGFAVRSREWGAGSKLRVAGQLRAGQVWTGGGFEDGTAVEIMTGAPVPTGADAVAMIEHVEQSNHEVWAASGRTLRRGENIVPRGSEARRGDVVVQAGTLIGAAEIAESASSGRAQLTVRRRPSVSIVATGDELVELTATPQDHQIRNSNSYGLATLVAAAGGEPNQIETAPDTIAGVRERIGQGRGADLLLLSGGVSAGKYDLVEEVLAELGGEFLFTGVTMQPGKPLVFGRLPAEEAGRVCYFFGLPGNPVSTQVTFHCFVEPFFRTLCGAAWSGPGFVQATLGEDVAAKPGLTRVLPARLVSDLVQPMVSLVGWHGSGDLAANARANCYAVIPAGETLTSGAVITVLLR
ncbi:MAG: molybdopterin molybdotransferase MoeA [Acidobacteriaceae bacterium]